MKRRLLSILALAAALSAQAVPAHPRPFVFRQPDGTLITVTLIGDEFEHYYLTAEGDTLTETFRDGGWWLEPAERIAPESRRAAAQRAKRASELGHYPTLGSPRELVLLVEYPDCRFRHDAETFQRMLCEEGYSDDGATGSAFDYFRDQSRGLFTPDITVVGPVMLPHPRAYYGTPTANMYDAQPWLMLTDAAPQVDAEVDFSQFDNDGDGFVDNVFVFYAGEGQNDGGPLEAVWPHAANIWTYYGLDCTLDGVQLGSYACTNEITGAGRLTGIGTFVHEYSHVLGLPDLYSTQGASNCFSPGAFEVMDSGSYNNEGRTPPNMSAYDLTALGWAMAEPLTAPETVVLQAPSTLQPPSTPQRGAQSPADSGEGQLRTEPPSGGDWGVIRSIATVKPEEYYLLENRQQVGWDAYIPGHGMLIWHIDYDARAWADNQVNVLPAHQRVDLVEADGVLTKETQDGDPFPGARQTTSANLLPWTGVPIDAAITEIKESLPLTGGQTESTEAPKAAGGHPGGTEAPLQSLPLTGGQTGGIITFKFRGGGERIEAPVALEACEVGPCGFTACWTGVPAVTDYEVIVWRGDEAVPTASVAAAQAAEGGTGWTTTVGGLEPSTRYRYAVVARDGERRSPLSNEVWVTTLAPTFDMLAPEGLTAEAYNGSGAGESAPSSSGASESALSGSGAGGSALSSSGAGGGILSGSGASESALSGSGAASWRLAWTPLDGAVSYEAEIYAHSVVAPEAVTLDFTGGIAALPAGWTTTSTQTSGVAGTFGAARPSLLLQSGEWLLSPVYSEPIGDYSFWCKGEVEATLTSAGRQLRLTNTGDAPAYIDDVVVSYGGAVEHTAVEVFATTNRLGTTANGLGTTADSPASPGDAAAAWLVVTPEGQGALWARVRGVNAEGLRSQWSEEVALPLLEGITVLKVPNLQHKTAYRIPPFITITTNGRKIWKNN